MKQDLLWLQKYDLAKVYFEHYGNLSIPRTFKTSNGYEYDPDGVSLGYWLDNQRKSMDGGNLSYDRLKMLNDIDITWNLKSRKNKWFGMYELLKKYYEYHGNTEVPYHFRTSNGYEYDENGEKLGVWVANQRRYFLDEEKRQLLKDVEFRFELIDHSETWNRNYLLLKNYFEHYGNIRIKNGFKTSDGINEDNNGIDLSWWLRIQISAYRNGTMDPQRCKLLEACNIKSCINKYENDWLEMYDLACKYYMHYHDLEVSMSFKTKDGVHEDDDGECLGYWIKNQRSSYIEGRLSEDREKLLRKINMRFESNKLEMDWEKKYNFLKKYVKLYGIDSIIDRIISGDKFGFKGIKVNLYNWISTQKKKYYEGKLSDEKIDKLLKLGVSFKKHDYDEIWNDSFSLAKAYYEHYGNLEIVRSFITLDGITIDKNGQPLGRWINTQRYNFKNQKLSDDKINKLNSIGMIWNTVKNVDDIANLCIENNINFELNKDILKHISYQEMYVKISFLKDLGIDIVNSGKLHEIFSLSNMNMKTLYGVTLEDLINKYYDIAKGKILNK